jgi:hypothetical protein
MKKLLLILTLSLALLESICLVVAFAHSGGTNSEGCHHDRQANPFGEHYRWDWDYHCH